MLFSIDFFIDSVSSYVIIISVRNDLKNMQTWRLIDTGKHNGYYNMAVDEAIAIAVREGRARSTLRFYSWDPPCISIGYFQKPDERMTGSIVRRITGGRAVFHGSDLSYSVVSRTDNTLFPKNITGTYSAIAKALASGLRRLGINPDNSEGMDLKKTSTTKYQKTALCFNTVIRHEITVHGKKLIGSAQRRWPDVFLQHGSILVNGALSENGPSSVSLRELSSICPEPVSGSQRKRSPNQFWITDENQFLVASLSRGFTETLGIQFMTEDLSAYESELAEKLIADKYSRL